MDDADDGTEEPAKKWEEKVPRLIGMCRLLLHTLRDDWNTTNAERLTQISYCTELLSVGASSSTASPMVEMASNSTKNSIEVLDLDEIPSNWTLTWNLNDQPLATPHVVMMVLFTVLFVVGVCGNGRVLYVIISLLLRRSRNSARHIQLYVLSLSCADLLVVCCIPVLVTNIAFGFRLGSTSCKAYLCTERLNQILNPLLLVALSINGYLAACHLHMYRRVAQARVALVLIAVAVVISLAVIATPILRFAKVKAMGRRYVTDEVELTFKVERLVCMFQPPEEVEQAFIATTFVVGFLLTSLWQIFFYTMLVVTLCKHMRNATVQTSIPLWHISRGVMVVVGFYLICWTPYWIQTLYISFGDTSNMTGEAWFVIGNINHFLPFVHASIDPTLYSVLNRSVRESSARESMPSMTVGVTTRRGDKQSAQNNDATELMLTDITRLQASNEKLNRANSNCKL